MLPAMIIGAGRIGASIANLPRMQQLIAKFDKEILGVLSGFDRVLFRGTLPRLSHSAGMSLYLTCP